LIYLKNINIKILKQLEKNCNESLSQLYLRINDLRVKNKIPQQDFRREKKDPTALSEFIVDVRKRQKYNRFSRGPNIQSTEDESTATSSNV